MSNLVPACGRSRRRLCVGRLRNPETRFEIQDLQRNRLPARPARANVTELKQDNDGLWCGLRAKVLAILRGCALEKLNYDTGLGGYRTDITEQQLRGAPAFSRDRTYDWTDRSRERELHDYYRSPYYWDPDRH
jgi:hypothetical protein